MVEFPREEIAKFHLQNFLFPISQVLLIIVIILILSIKHLRRNISAGILISNNQYLEKFLYITWSNLTTC